MSNYHQREVSSRASPLIAEPGSGIGRISGDIIERRPHLDTLSGGCSSTLALGSRLLAKEPLDRLLIRQFGVRLLRPGGTTTRLRFTGQPGSRGERLALGT